MKYTSSKDPYVYDDAPDVLINKLNIKNLKDLDEVETYITTQKAKNIINYPKGNYDLKHLQNIHQYLFGDIYDWAGELRSVTTQKGTTVFANPIFIETSFKDLHKQIIKDDCLKNISAKELHKPLAYYHSEANIIHPFRDGNGRVIRAYLSLMALQNHNYEINYKLIDRVSLVKASINGGAMDYRLMEDIYKKILSPVIKNKEKMLDRDR